MNPEDRLFGEVAIKLGFMSREAASHCLRVHRTERQGLRFAQVARELNLVDERQLALVEQHVTRILEQQRAAAASKPAPDPAPPPPSREASLGSDSMLTAPHKVGARATPTASETRPSGFPRAPDALETHSIQPPPRKQISAQAPLAESGDKTPYLAKALAYAVRQGASDLHLHSGAPLLARIHGRLAPLKDDTIVTAEEAERFIAEILSDTQWQQLAEKGEVDFAYAIAKVGRFRVNAYRQQRGLDIVMRIIPEEVPTIAQLGLPETISKLVDYRTGIVLCTGPAGCGKSTTLAALLRHLIDTRGEHVITIENPVEFVFKEGKSIVNQRQVGDHTSSFARALRAALREDPDVIAITELRDRESIALALSAAETGHLVLGTLHTGNAGQTISRIVNAFGAEEQGHIRTMLSESLRAVVSQRLVPKLDGSGRVLAFELLMCNIAVANMIRDDKMFQINSIMQTGKALGMVTLDDSLWELTQKGVVKKDEARRFAENKDRFR